MIAIGSHALSATINPFGAELSSLRDCRGQELMTCADPAFWTGRAPLLFPIVGALAGGHYRVDGQEFSLPSHGFARRMAFETVEASAQRAVFELADNAATRATYPYSFALTAAFSIENATLSMAVTAQNRGDVPMPASFGFHPAFAWPLPNAGHRAEHRILFEKAETTKLSRITPDSLIGPTDVANPLDGRTLRLRDELFARDALVWPAIESQSLLYGTNVGPQLRIDFPDTPMLGIWTLPGAHFVCIEPWHGLADPEGFDGEIWDKPGIMRIAPGLSRTFHVHITAIEGAAM